MENEKRLIDADAEIEAIKKYVCQDCESYNGIRCRACWADDLISWIEDAPKVDAVEVVHGRWVIREFHLSNTKKMSCNCCDYSENKGPAWDKSWGVPNYCPNCGAKMDGDGND